MIVLTAVGSRADAARITAKDIRPERELLITAPTIVDAAAAQYPGAWSFGTLVEQMVGPELASAAIRNWLKTWVEAQNVNGLITPARLGIVKKVITPWQKRDGYDVKSDKEWEPKLANAPFRLLAIVNRMDLAAPELADSFEQVRDLWQRRGQEKLFLKLLEESTKGILGPTNGSYGGTSELETRAGEGRLIFTAIDEEGAPIEGGWTIIFEYHLAVTKTKTLRDWAHSWHTLGAIDVVDASFPGVLQQVTMEFTHKLDSERRTVHLAQLRTSEAAFGEGREFRQFQLVDNRLKPSALTLTPAPAFSAKRSAENRILAEFVHRQDKLIRSGIHCVPLQVADGEKDRPLVGGSALIPADQPDFHWDLGPRVSRDARRVFSLNTCNGCHAGETGCRDGLHVHPRLAGEAARTSDFLRLDGKTLRLNDPNVRGSKIEYREMADRAAIFAALLEPKDRAMIEALRPILRERLERTH